MTTKMRVLLIIVSVLAAVFMSLGTPIGGFFFAPGASARPVPVAPEPSLFSVLALIGAYFIVRSRRR